MSAGSAPWSWNVAADVLEERALLATPTLDWAYSLGTTTGQATVNNTGVDASGNVYIAGVVTRGTVDLDPSAQSADVTANAQTGFVAKYDASGVFLWVETFASDTAISPLSLSADHAGGVYVVGAFLGTATFGAGEAHDGTLENQGGRDANGFLLQLDQTTGNVNWIRGILGDLPLGATNVAVDAANSVTIAGLSSTGVVTIVNGETGATLQSLSLDASNYVARFDTAGGVSWAVGFATGGASVAAGGGLAVDPAGNVYLAGTLTGREVDFDPGAGTYLLSRSSWRSNAFIAKLDVDGGFQWVTKDEAAAAGSASATSIAVDSTGSAYVTLRTLGNGWSGGWHGGGQGWWGGNWYSGLAKATEQIARIDSDGDWQWVEDLTRPDRRPPAGDHCPGWMSPGPSGSGWHSTNDGKHGGNSNSGWKHNRPLPTVSNTTAKVKVDADNNAIVVGANATATQYTPSGDVGWSSATALPVTDLGIDAAGNLYLVGMFRGWLNVNPGTEETLIKAHTKWWARAPFLARWNPPSS